MKKNIITIALACLCCMASQAQERLFDRVNVKSPVVNGDGTVTFNLFAPKAIKVEVAGDFLESGVAQMKEGQNGVWTYTTAPLEGELYSYSFIVDGIRMLDPSNVFQNRDVATWTSIFTLSAEKGDKGWYYETHDIPHGTVSHVWYNSPTLKA